jgi:hypothetical protein
MKYEPSLQCSSPRETLRQAMSRPYGAGWILPTVGLSAAGDVQKAWLFMPFRLGRAGAVFGGFPVRGAGKERKGHKWADFEEMGLL